ncbi:MAG: pentapeptide repeat-containing protein [Desulfovibrio sp.]|nr:pentapeptide repeat-containing protein [Desulfovibrio sp.]
MFHAPVEEKFDVDNFNFQLKLYIKERVTDGRLINLRGVVFPHKVRFAELFQESTNNSYVDLTHCVFTKDVDCTESVFESGFNLNGSEFQSEVNFSNAKFNNKIDFIDTVFRNNVSFGGTVFQNGLLVFRTRFDQRVHFDSVTTLGLSIIASSIGDNIYFDESKIEKLEFINSKFYGHTALNTVQSKHVNLTRNMFDGDVDCDDIKIENDFIFERNLCRGGVYLRKASVSGDASFNRTKFKDYVSFEQAKFMGNLSFEEAYSSEAISFGKTLFGKSADFKAFSIGKTIQLSGIEMENVHLKNAQIEAFRFTNCIWPKQGDHSCVAGHSSSSHDELSDVYRRLKKVAKLDHDELRASEWHWQEKEMTYQSKETSKFIRSFLCLYRLFSGYGEEPNKALCWLVVFLLLPAIVFGLWMLSQTGISCTVDWAAVGNVGKDWYNSLPLAKLKLSDTLGTGKKVVYLIFQIIIALQASLFAFSLRNKLRR